MTYAYGRAGEKYTNLTKLLFHINTKETTRYLYSCIKSGGVCINPQCINPPSAELPLDGVKRCTCGNFWKENVQPTWSGAKNWGKEILTGFRGGLNKALQSNWTLFLRFGWTTQTVGLCRTRARHGLWDHFYDKTPYMANFWYKYFGGKCSKNHGEKDACNQTAFLMVDGKKVCIECKPDDSHGAWMEVNPSRSTETAGQPQTTRGQQRESTRGPGFETRIGCFDDVMAPYAEGETDL